MFLFKLYCIYFNEIDFDIGLRVGSEDVVIRYFDKIERETKTDTNRQRQTDRNRQTDRQMCKCICVCLHLYIHMYILVHKYAYIHSCVLHNGALEIKGNKTVHREIF